MNDFSLKQLEVFVAVAECSNFTRAGELLFLSQSTISAHIKALEQQLGVTLFVRAARRQVSLSTEGQRLYPEAKRVLSDCARLRAAVANEPQNLPLLLGASTVPAQCLLPDWLAAYQKKYPLCRWLLRRGDSAQIHEALKSGDIRIGFVGAKEETETLSYVPLVRDELVMVTQNNPRYRALLQQGIPGRALLGEPTVAREEGSGTDRAVVAYMRSIGFPTEQMHIVARADDPAVIRQMVERGVGVSVLSALAVRREVETGKLLRFHMDTQPLTRPIYLACREGLRYSREEEQFIQFIKQMTKGRY